MDAVDPLPPFQSCTLVEGRWVDWGGDRGIWLCSCLMTGWGEVQEETEEGGRTCEARGVSGLEGCAVWRRWFSDMESERDRLRSATVSRSEILSACEAKHLVPASDYDDSVRTGRSYLCCIQSLLQGL